MEKEISQAVIRRMPRYYRYLGELLEDGVERISSNDLSCRMKVTASQIRQDLNNFGGFGQQGYGYNVPFLYDTGYRQLFGMNGGLDRLVQELLIAAITIILAFGSVLSMEGEKKSWMLLGTTYVGKGNIIKIKWLICFICAFVIGTYSWIFRLIMINSKYPIGEVFYSAKCILGYNGYGVPLILFMLLEIVIHIILYMGMTAIVLAISRVLHFSL